MASYSSKNFKLNQEKGEKNKTAYRSSSQKMKRSPHCPIPATALDNSTKKKSNFECSEASTSFRDTKWSSSDKNSCQLEARCLKHKTGNKAERKSHMAHEKDEPDFQNRDFKSPSSADETVVRYLNDQPAIDALQNSHLFFEAVTPIRSKEEKTEGSRDEFAKMSLSITIPDAELKDTLLAESSASSANTSSTHRLAILKHRQYDAKLKKLKERIKKQGGFQGDLNSRGQFQNYVGDSVIVADAEKMVAPKVRKVTAASPAIKGFSPSEAKIHSSDERVWHEEEFLNLSRELCRDLERQLDEEDSVLKNMPAEKRKKKKANRIVRKIQKVTKLPGCDSKSGGFNIISTSSWRDGKRLAMKILGPAPKLKKQTPSSIDGSCSDRSIQCDGKMESDSKQDVAIKFRSRNPERSWSKMRRKNSLKKREATVQDTEQKDHRMNENFLSVEILDILDDLQVDSATHTKQETAEENPAAFTRHHSPSKKKSDKLAADKEPEVTCKKHHYDTDEVRQYIFKQKRERKKKYSEQKKAQKEATLQRTKKLQELYKKQREALTYNPKSSSATELVPKQLQETHSKLFLDQVLPGEPQAPLIQDVQPNPGYHPSEDSNKEDKVQEHPPCASSNSDMSLSEPHHSLVRDNQLEPLWIQPDRLSSKSQLSFPHPSTVLSGGSFSQHLSLDHMSVLQKDFNSLLLTRSHSTAIGFLPLASPPIRLTLQPTVNRYKSNMDRIEALKATAASLSSRIEREAKRLAGIGTDYGVSWSSGHNLVQGTQGDGYWAKVSSPPVREENNVFSATLQNRLSTSVSQTIFDNQLPGLENPGVGKTISPHSAAAISLPCKQISEGIVQNLSKEQNGSPNAESIAVLHDCSVQSISDKGLSDHLSEEDRNHLEHSPLKMSETLKEKEFCVAGKTSNEPTEQSQKEAENDLAISAQMKSASGTWEDITKGSPHSVINIFTKSNQLYGQGFEEWSGQGSPFQRPSLPAMSPPVSIVSYEDDFISSQGSGMVTDEKTAVEPSVGSSILNLEEEFISRKSPYELQVKEVTHHSSGTPSFSSCSSSFTKRRGEEERLESFTEVSGICLWEENKMFGESDFTRLETNTSVHGNGVSNREEVQNPESDTFEELSGHSLMSLPDKIRSPRTASCPQSPEVQKHLEAVAEQSRSSSRSQATILPGPKPDLAFPDMNLGAKRTGTSVLSDSMHFSPAGLQHQILAELHYLSTIEESLQQLSDVKQVPGISLVQQESISLAQILKAQKKQHEQDLDLLKLKAEQEALESQRQLKEAQEERAQACAESPQQLLQTQEDVAGALQETTCKIAAQQVEAAFLTSAGAWQIRKLTEIACAQNPDAVTVPANPVPLLLDQKQKHRSTSKKKVKARSDISRKTESITPSQNKEETGDSKHSYSRSFDSCSESSRSKVHDESGSSLQESPFVPFSKETKDVSHHEKSNSSIEEEGLTAENNSLQSNSIPSVPDVRDSTSVATEYSLKFDSMTEDEMEEKSFRSLLPSESHRQITLKKQGHHGNSNQEVSIKMSLSSVKELSLPFSGGQDSFSKFTMEMVRQYMKEEEMRAAHQSSLLRLRQKALKEKTKAELAWLRHQEKHLRDKGEDDKMPPIRKKQRGLILKLQQEKVEIKRLQEANKAAQKERQLILKQQEEIERICQTTMKLQEKLKSEGEKKLEHCSEDDAKPTHSSSPLPGDAETCSPSSISSSETRSIMQKLKKMHNRADKKYLTKREQKLMQRRQNAEELLQWKCRLDAEEAEIRQIERHALAAWDKKLLETKANKMAAGDQNDQKETASEEDSSVPPCSHFSGGSSFSEELGNLAVESDPSKVSGVQGQLESPHHTTIMVKMVDMQNIESSASPGKLSPKNSTSLLKQGSSKRIHRARGQKHLPVKSQETYSWSDESLSMALSETISDQSDIENRIQALKDELRNRKSVVYQLIKEQKKRHKARLKAQEASLVKQLETYDEFIKKTEAELSQDLEAAPTAKLQIKTPSFVIEKPKIKLPPLPRHEKTRSWKSLTDSEHWKDSLESITKHTDAVSLSERSSYTKKLIEAKIQTEEHFRAPSPVLKAPQKAGAESGDSPDSFPSWAVLKDLGDLSKTSHVSQIAFEDATSCDTHVSINRSVVQEKVEYVKSVDSEPDDTHKFSGRSDASVSDTKQKNCLPVSLKTDVHPEISLAIVCVQDGKEIPKQEERYRDEKCAASGQSSQKLNKTLLSEQLSTCAEPLYSNGFERSSSSKYKSDDGVLSTEYHKDDFDSAVSSFGKDSRSHREKPRYAKTGSRSASIESDEEVNECLSDLALSVASSVHSERLLILKSPTERLKSKERSDVERESAHLDPSFRASSSKIEEEENTLQDFSIGDRVVVSNVQPGTLRFKGLTKFAKGFWAGVELEKPEGRNNGTYDGIKYFDCKEKHGIFAPPQKISRISESGLMDTKEHSFCMIQLDHSHKAYQKDRESHGEEEEESEGEIVSEKPLQDKSLRDASALEDSVASRVYLNPSAPQSRIVAAAEDILAEEQSVVKSLKSSGDSRLLAASTSDALSETSAVAVEGALDGIVYETWKQQQPSWQEYTEKSESLFQGVLEKSTTPLMDLFTKARLRFPSHGEEETKDRKEKVELLMDSLLQVFVKDTLNQLQQIRKARHEKIQFSNQELAAVQEQKLAAGNLLSILMNFQLDNGEEVSSPDLCSRPENPIFGASGQEELAKRLAELEYSQEFLSVLGDDQDWFDEEFGSSSYEFPLKLSAVLPKIELPKVSPKLCEQPLAVLYTAKELEVLVHETAEELWKYKELGHDLQAASFHRDLRDSPKDDDIGAISKQIYKQAVFDLTRETFGEIFAEDPNLSQPIWMKPCRITSTYFHRVKDPSDLAEVKSFIAAEVLKLLNWKKEPSNRVGWQKMIRFGHKKCDRVDQLLLQELHEEEAQWMNYEEEELYVKTHLADGVFEALIRETIDVLNQIEGKQNRLLHM